MSYPPVSSLFMAQVSFSALMLLLKAKAAKCPVSAPYYRKQASPMLFPLCVTSLFSVPPGLYSTCELISPNLLTTPLCSRIEGSGKPLNCLSTLCRTFFDYGHRPGAYNPFPLAQQAPLMCQLVSATAACLFLPRSPLLTPNLLQMFAVTALLHKLF